MKYKFKRGDIVTFYESFNPWVVLGYKRIFPTREIKVKIRRIRLPSHPLKEVLGYANEEDLILS